MTPEHSLPNSPESIRIHTRTATLAGLDYGNGAAPPMVLLHGIRDLAWSMDPIARAFRQDYHVVALDLRGHGDSEAARVYTLAHFVGDLRLGLRSLSIEHPVLVGHSLGGQIVAQYAAIFGNSVAACVLIEGLGPPRRQGEATLEGRREIARASIEALVEEAAEREPIPDLAAAKARILRNHPRLGPDRAGRLATRATRAGPEGGMLWKWDPHVQTVWSSVTREQNEERWGWIDCPVLVVTGETSGEWWTRRRNVPAASAFRGPLAREELLRRLGCFRDVRHVEIPDAGHMIHFDQPRGLTTAIREFLKSSAPPAVTSTI